MRNRENISKAVSLYEKALKNNPDNTELIVEYISALRLDNKLSDAMGYLENLSPSVTGNYKTIKASATVYRDNHNFQKAIDTLLESENLTVWEGETGPHRCYLECSMALGNKALLAGDYVVAEKYFSDTLEHPEQLLHSKANDENESAGYYHLGILYEKMGDMSKANEYYHIAVDQPTPNYFHKLSYRENEYYMALAAHKIGESHVYDKIVKRLIDIYDENFSARGVDFAPTAELYSPHLAAARGFILIKDFEKANKCLDNLRRTYGYCWMLEEAMSEISANLKLRMK